MASGTCSIRKEKLNGHYVDWSRRLTNTYPNPHLILKNEQSCKDSVTRATNHLK